MISPDASSVMSPVRAIPGATILELNVLVPAIVWLPLFATIPAASAV